MGVINRCPARSGMTVIAFRNSNKVIIQPLRLIARGGGAVMAARAAIGNALMIECGISEGRGGMTGRAIEAGRDMVV